VIEDVEDAPVADLETEALVEVAAACVEESVNDAVGLGLASTVSTAKVLPLESTSICWR
jgi:hypothetical protein